MKPEQQRVAIAEWCGWKMVKGVWVGSGCNHLPDPPDYLNDLNAMHEAEAQLPDLKVSRYVSEIWGAMCRTNAPECAIGTIHATAAQRAEALLKTIGKWVEE